MGGEQILAMLKGGGQKRCWGTFPQKLEVLAILKERAKRLDP